MWQQHSDTDIEVSVEEGVYNFSFDRIFGDRSTQLEVFDDTAHPLIKDVLSGYNATIFAYGQTGTGKVKILSRIYMYIAYTRKSSAS